MTDRKPNSKLELTWIGKDNQPKLEPRILIEDQERSYGGRSAPNMLIFGDNLLALKALEQEARSRKKSSAALERLAIAFTSLTARVKKTFMSFSFLAGKKEFAG